MSREQKVSNNNEYYTVIDGTFRVQVPSSHPEAVQRDWVVKDSSGTKYERHVKSLIGKIEDIQVNDGEYGKSLNIYLDENENGKTPVISLGVGSRYGEDVLKKLPNLKNEEYKFQPFDFEDENNADRRIRGVSIYSEDGAGEFTVKVGNYFYDGKKNLHGFPEPTDEDKEDWAFYFKKVNKFLVKYAEEKIVPKYQKDSAPVKYPEEESFDPSKIPF